MGRPYDKRLFTSVREATDVRLVLPFGLSLVAGDVVSVDRDCNLILEGSTRSVLGMEPGAPREPSAPGDLYRLNGEGSRCTFRAAVDASTPVPGAGPLSAGFDIHFDSTDGWLLAARGRQLNSLDELHRFRQPILTAHAGGVWKPDWALVVEVATAQRVTLLVSRMANTDIALALGAAVPAHAGLEVKLTADVSVSRTNQQITQWITSAPAVMGFRALRVDARWLRSPTVATLAPAGGAAANALSASDADFWKDADDLR